MSLFDEAIFEEPEPLLWADLDDNPDRPPWETPESWAIEKEKQMAIEKEKQMAIEKEKQMGNHFIEKCSCGTVIEQYRCPDKNKTVAEGCVDYGFGAARHTANASPAELPAQQKAFGPADVDTSNHLRSTFGKFEVEDAAVKLIEYLTTIPPSNPPKNPWFFTLSGLISYYSMNDWNINEALFGLLGSWFDDGGMKFMPDPGYILHWGSGLSMTTDFLKRISKYVR